MSKMIYALVIIGFFAGIAVGYAVFSGKGGEAYTPSKSDNSTLPISEVERRVEDYMNKKLVKPGISVEIGKATEQGIFYKFDVNVLKNGEVVTTATVYATKDGRYLILNMVNISKSMEFEVSIEGEPAKGDQNAKITIVEFSGYDCPFCAKFAKETLNKILNNFSVRFVFKDFPVHGEVKAHEAANCAMEQGKYWEYHDMLFDRQGEWRKNESKFIEYAKELGLDVNKFKDCLESDKYREEVLEDRKEGIDLGVSGTPTFFINGKKIVGALPYKEFEKVIKEIESEN